MSTYSLTANIWDTTSSKVKTKFCYKIVARFLTIDNVLTLFHSTKLIMSLNPCCGTKWQKKDIHFSWTRPEGHWGYGQKGCKICDCYSGIGHWGINTCILYVLHFWFFWHHRNKNVLSTDEHGCDCVSVGNSSAWK